MPFVSRAGEKLDHAIRQFGLSVSGKIAADFGSHAGGFVDCLLQHDIQKVYAVETGYGVLEWKLRKDPRVSVLERKNALHVTLPEKVDLITIDVGWTPQTKIIPAARKWLKPGGAILSLVKPHYEAEEGERVGGKVLEEYLPMILQRVEKAAFSGAVVQGESESPLRGEKGGNREFFYLLTFPEAA